MNWNKILGVLGLFSLLTCSLWAEDREILIEAPADAQVIRIDATTGQWVYSGDTIAVLKKKKNGAKVSLRAGVAGKIVSLHLELLEDYSQGEQLGVIRVMDIVPDEPISSPSRSLPEAGELAGNLFKATGVSKYVNGQKRDWTHGSGRMIMIFIGGVLLYLGIRHKFEPLLLVPIGFGAILSNLPAGLDAPGGLLHYIYEIGITTGIFPLLIFMGVGAMTDFGPMIANPKTALLGGAAQFGIFITLLGAICLNLVPGINFSLQDAAAIGIIGGADGPTAIFLSSQLSPRLLGSIAVAAYSYMALVPIIQPPIMRRLTTEEERKIQMVQLRYVSKIEKIIFPLLVLAICGLLLPSAVPLIGMFMFGNLARECGVIERLSSTIQNSLINTVTIFLGLGVGSKLSADQFLNIETVGILVLGIVAFGIGTASGILMGKLMNRYSSTPINPLIGSAGVSAVPMAARVTNQVGLEANPQNFLLMHAMGANVSGVVGSAVAAGVLLAVL